MLECNRLSSLSSCLSISLGPVLLCATAAVATRQPGTPDLTGNTSNLAEGGGGATKLPTWPLIESVVPVTQVLYPYVRASPNSLHKVVTGAASVLPYLLLWS